MSSSDKPANSVSRLRSIKSKENIESKSKKKKKGFKFFISIANLILSLLLLFITTYYYWKGSEYNQKLFGQTTEQIKYQHDKDSAVKIQDRIDKRKDSIMNDAQLKNINSSTKQSDAIQSEAETQKKMFQTQILSSLPLIDWGNFAIDSVSFMHGFNISIFNKGGRAVEIKKMTIFIYNNYFDYYNFQPYDYPTTINPTSSIIFHFENAPLLVIKSRETKYHIVIKAKDLATETTYPVEYFFQYPFGSAFTLVSPNDQQHFKSVEKNYFPSTKLIKSYTNTAFRTNNVLNDTLNEYFNIKPKSVLQNLFLGRSPKPAILSVVYRDTIIKENTNPQHGILAIFNLSKSFPFHILIDEKVNYDIEDNIKDYKIGQDQSEDIGLTTGYHKYKIIYNLNKNYTLKGIIKIVSNKIITVRIT